MKEKKLMIITIISLLILVAIASAALHITANEHSFLFDIMDIDLF